ncbi:MAG: hypothetical protein FJ253_09175, partial [Phycisphaerae bacterium]|nr:hypothetical protein [Phycisphaerae bacterium]
EALSTLFVDRTQVTLSGARAGEIIRFTLDGSEPNGMSPVAQGAVTLDRSCTLSARIFEGEIPRSATSLREFTKVMPQTPVTRALGPTPGLRATFSTRDRFEKLADIDGAKVVGSLVVPPLSLDQRPRKEHFAIVFEGLLRVPRDGVWRLGLESDDGARLLIGGRVVVDIDGLHVATRRDAEVALAEGWHAIRVEYFNAGGDSALRMDWEGPGQSRTEIPVEMFGWTP